MDDFAREIKRLSYSELGSAISLYKQSFNIPSWFETSFLPDMKPEWLKHSDTFGVYSGNNLIGAITVYPKGQMALIAQTAIDSEYRGSGIFRKMEEFLSTDYKVEFSGKMFKPSILVRESPDPDMVQDLIGVKVGTKNVLTDGFNYYTVEEIQNRYFVKKYEDSWRLPGYVLGKEFSDIPSLRYHKSADIKIKLPDRIDEKQRYLFSIHAASRFAFAFGMNVDKIYYVDEIPDDMVRVSVKYSGRNNNELSGSIISTFSEDVSMDDVRYDLLAGPEVSVSEKEIMFDGMKISEGVPKAPGEMNLYVLYDKTNPVEIAELVSQVQELENKMANSDIRSTVRYLSHMRGGHTTHIVSVKSKWIGKSLGRLEDTDIYDFVARDDSLVFLGHAPEIRADPVLKRLFFME